MAKPVVRWTEHEEEVEDDDFLRTDAEGVRALFEGGEWETCFRDLVEYGDYDTLPHDGLVKTFHVDPDDVPELERQIAALTAGR